MALLLSDEERLAKLRAAGQAGYNEMAASMPTLRTSPIGQGEITQAHPSLGEKVSTWLNDTFYGGGKMAYSPARHFETPVNWSPPGMAFESGQMIGEDMNKGDAGGAGRDLAMAMVPGAAKGRRALRIGERALAHDAGLLGDELLNPAATIGHNGPVVTGSLNPLDEAPFTFNGKHPHEWDQYDFEAAGQHFGVKDLGPMSKPVEYDYQDGSGKFAIPGGVDGKFTYYDLLHLKANPVNPSKVDRDLHAKIQQKLGRTMTPDGADDEAVWNGLVFGMTSPNNPLFPNQLAASRLRYRDPQMIDDLAGMIPWGPDEKPDAATRKAVNDAIASRFGLAAASKDGLGVRGSTDYTRVGEMARMFKQDPGFFRKKPNETWGQFVEKVSSQVPGLSMKTGSFGSVWQDPANAAISAIDRHMAVELKKTGNLFRDPAQELAWQKRVVDRWNKANPDRAYANFDELAGKPGTEGHIGGMLLEYVGDAKTPKFRTGKNKQINPEIPAHLANAKWVQEPETVFKMGEAYNRALNLNHQLAQKHGLGLFNSQWMEWDRIRRRLEPHENMFPGLSKMPAMSREQLRVVDAEHRASGHKNYTKVDGQGRKLKDVPEGELPDGAYLQPTKKRENPSRFAYFSVPAGLLGGGAAYEGMQQDEMGNPY
jgi:hypothetical protein